MLEVCLLTEGNLEYDVLCLLLIPSMAFLPLSSFLLVKLLWHPRDFLCQTMLAHHFSGLLPLSLAHSSTGRPVHWWGWHHASLHRDRLVYLLDNIGLLGEYNQADLLGITHCCMNWHAFPTYWHDCWGSWEIMCFNWHSQAPQMHLVRFQMSSWKVWCQPGLKGKTKVTVVLLLVQLLKKGLTQPVFASMLFSSAPPSPPRFLNLIFTGISQHVPHSFQVETARQACRLSATKFHKFSLARHSVMLFLSC